MAELASIMVLDLGAYVAQDIMAEDVRRRLTSVNHSRAPVEQPVSVMGNCTIASVR